MSVSACWCDFSRACDACLDAAVVRARSSGPVTLASAPTSGDASHVVRHAAPLAESAPTKPVGGLTAAELRKVNADGRELALRTMGHPYRQLRDSDWAEADLSGLRAVAAAGAARWQEANGKPPVFVLPAEAARRPLADWAGWEPREMRDGAHWLQLPGPPADPEGGDLVEVAPAVRYEGAYRGWPVVLLEIDGTCVVNGTDASVRPRLSPAQARAMARLLEDAADEAERRAAEVGNPTRGTGLAR